MTDRVSEGQKGSQRSFAPKKREYWTHNNGGPVPGVWSPRWAGRISVWTPLRDLKPLQTRLQH